MYETYGYVLDYLKEGYPEDDRPSYMKESIIQIIGENRFTLLEATPKPKVEIEVYERVFVGKTDREKVGFIKRRIAYEDLTSAAKVELPYVVEKIVDARAEDFIDWFNKAPPLTTRMHSLELIPGIGKKIMWEMLSERKRKPFSSFEDLAQRVHLVPDPKKAVVKKIISEIQELDKYYLFANVMRK
jgi:putative nucleotide binding protein